MSMGGSASNNGIRFVSDKYSAEFVLNKDGTYEIKTKKQPIDSKIRKTLKRIPIVKGLYSMFSISRWISILLIFSVFMDFFPIEKSDSLIYHAIEILTYVIAIIALIYVGKKVVFNAKETRRFHGAEHKTIYAFENGMELTLENVRSCPRIAKRCGTNLVVFLLLFFAVGSFFTDYTSVVFVVAFVLGYELFDLDNGDKIPIIKLFFKLGYWCQEKLFTAEPTDEQITASIAAVNKITELEKEVGTC